MIACIRLPSGAEDQRGSMGQMAIKAGVFVRDRRAVLIQKWQALRIGDDPDLLGPEA